MKAYLNNGITIEGTVAEIKEFFWKDSIIQLQLLQILLLFGFILHNL
jgi:hypothetical protein